MSNHPIPILLCLGLLGGGALYPAEVNIRSLPHAESIAVEPDAAPRLVFKRLSIETRRDYAGESVSTWTGYVEGDPLSRAVLTTRRGVTAGLITTSQGAWQLTPTPRGSVLKPIDYSGGPECDVVSDDAPRSISSPITSPLKTSSLIIIEPVIDLLVLYSAASRDAAGGVAGIEAAIANAVAITNDALERSDVRASVRLVRIALLPIIPAGQKALDFLLSDATVNALRDTMNADLVSAIVEADELPNLCGQAYLFWGGSGSAFSVVRRGCISHSFAHEIGHNLGMHHEPEDIRPPNTAAPWLPNVNFAHYFCGDASSPGWGTIMAGSKMPCNPGVRVPYFSNPQVLHQGRATGIENERNNALIGRLTAPVVAGFRGSCSPSSIGLCLSDSRFRITAQYATPGEVFKQAFAVQLTPDTGYFWFFSDANVEVLVKVINACSFNNRFWVFSSGLTNLNVEILIEDTKTGEVHRYINPPDTVYQTTLDTNAFATCP